MIERGLIQRLIDEASLAPSVHNVQPARWRIEQDGVSLFEDTTRRLPAGDPSGRDALVSLGAATEGFRIAASVEGLAIDCEKLGSPNEPPLRPVARLRLAPGASPDPLAAFVRQRSSWRAPFQKVADEARDAALALASDDLAVINLPDRLTEAGRMLDDASWSFISDDAFRAELLSWLRLSRSDPRWKRDGLNAEAMAMGGIEAFGAGLVLGPLFKPLKAVGLARRLVAEGKQASQAAALVILHRPAEEPPYVSGGHFYRAWLKVEAAGFAASVLASLVDNPQSSAWCAREIDLPPKRRLVGVLRIGRRPNDAGYARARLPLGELILD